LASLRTSTPLSSVISPEATAKAIDRSSNMVDGNEHRRWSKGAITTVEKGVDEGKGDAQATTSTY
jgi:hypothetical protein